MALAAVKPVARRAILSLILFGIAFGQVEAAVVVYLRTIAAPIRASLGLPAGEPMPLFGPSHLGPLQHLVYIELAREAATLIMLAAVAYAVSKNLPTWLAAFSVAFGAWDAYGAKSFGYSTFWVNRFNVPAEKLGVQADGTSNNFQGLLDFVLGKSSG